MITSAQLKSVFPLCRDPTAWASILSKTAAEFDISTATRFGMWLAQIGHESTQFNSLRENMSYSMLGLMKTWPKRFPTEDSTQNFVRQPERLANYVYANRMGNGDFASGDGWRFRGGGLIQLTGRENYRDAGKSLDLPLETQPLKILEPAIAAKVAGAFWKMAGCNELADAHDFETVTRRINGGLNGLKEREEYWNKLEAIL